MLSVLFYLRMVYLNLGSLNILISFDFFFNKFCLIDFLFTLTKTIRLYWFAWAYFFRLLFFCLFFIKILVTNLFLADKRIILSFAAFATVKAWNWSINRFFFYILLVILAINRFIYFINSLKSQELFGFFRILASFLSLSFTGFRNIE